MDHKTFFLKYWEKEGPATRKVIVRIPQDRSDYQADPKARTAREIAWLMVREETALVEGLENGTFEWIELPRRPHGLREFQISGREHRLAKPPYCRAVPSDRPASRQARRG